MLNLIQKIAGELDLKDFQVNNTVKLMFEEECTIPFVARYRKEMTGSLDEVVLRTIRDRFHYLQELESNKVKYLKVVEEHCSKKPELKGKFAELKAKFEACETKQALEDLYLPFKPKRRTRGQIAKEKGLEALLEKILAGQTTITDLVELAAEFVTPEDAKVEANLRVKTAKDALTGASDIYVERIAETAELRQLVREMSFDTGVLTSKKIEHTLAATDEKKGKKVDPSKYENYFEYSESIKTAQSHRVMAVRRGEAEKVLKMSIVVDADNIVAALKKEVLTESAMTPAVKGFLETATEDAYKRSLSPALETEMRLHLKSTAENDAIKVFSENLSNLLLLPPIPGKVVLGVDPGLRTGSKLAAVDETGKLLDSATIYPDLGGRETNKTAHAKSEVLRLIKAYDVKCVAIGNGTGSREINRLVTTVIKENELKDVKRLVVSEAGASVYSTMDIAREEFPDLDPTIRSAVSIARRLQDPLAELVKIDPRSIGVGQYQHDVNVAKLNKSLTEVVESCVNRVGVNVNTASYKLLGYVSGIGGTVAKNIVASRDKNGKFTSRDSLLKVTGLGPKAYQQAAGFLRVPESENPLDNSSVHPESYDIVEQIVGDQKLEVSEIVGNKANVEAISLEKYVTERVGMPTLQDIATELVKPGRDPREEGTRLMYSDDVSEIEDLALGMKVPGTVTNVTKFGAFVDIGVHQDGLIHISELSDQFVDDPSKVIAVGDVVEVKVIDLDIQRRRIGLTRRLNAQAPAKAAERPRERPQGASRSKMSSSTKRGPIKDRGFSTKQKAKAVPDKNYTMDDLLAKFGKR